MAFTLSHEVTRRPGQEPSRQEKGGEGGVAAVRTDCGVCHQGLSLATCWRRTEQGRATLEHSGYGEHSPSQVHQGLQDIVTQDGAALTKGDPQVLQPHRHTEWLRLAPALPAPHQPPRFSSWTSAHHHPPQLAAGYRVPSWRLPPDLG